MPEQPTSAVQDYLKAIHSLDGAEKTVLPVKIAEALNVRAPSVTGMLKRLAEAGWIEYEPGVGARLTPQGVTEARRVIRRHRLVELFPTRLPCPDPSRGDPRAEPPEHPPAPGARHPPPPGRAARSPARPPHPDARGRPPPPRPETAVNVPRRPARRHPRGEGRLPRAPAPLADARPDAGRDSPHPQPPAAG